MSAAAPVGATIVALAGVAVLMAGCAGEPAGYDAPAAVCHDVEADVYLVASRHGEASAKDGKGYISRVPPDDEAGMDRYWIAGGRGGVTLNAPSSLAVRGETLFVTDIDVVRRFDRRSGAPQGELTIPEAELLCACSTGPDGTLYVADRGAAGVGGAIWRLAPDAESPERLVAGAELGQPAALVARPAAVYVVNTAGAFFQIDRQGRRTPLGQLPAGGVSGLARHDGTYYMTSAEARCVYRFAVTGGVETVPGQLEQPGSCAFDVKRRRLLVPSISGNRLASVAVSAR